VCVLDVSVTPDMLGALYERAMSQLL
jgi:hypothetical protein